MTIQIKISANAHVFGYPAVVTLTATDEGMSVKGQINCQPQNLLQQPEMQLSALRKQLPIIDRSTTTQDPAQKEQAYPTSTPQISFSYSQSKLHIHYHDQGVLFSLLNASNQALREQNGTQILLGLKTDYLDRSGGTLEQAFAAAAELLHLKNLILFGSTSSNISPELLEQLNVFAQDLVLPTAFSSYSFALVSTFDLTSRPANAVNDLIGSQDMLCAEPQAIPCSLFSNNPDPALLSQLSLSSWEPPIPAPAPAPAPVLCTNRTEQCMSANAERTADNTKRTQVPSVLAQIYSQLEHQIKRHTPDNSNSTEASAKAYFYLEPDSNALTASDDNGTAFTSGIAKLTGLNALYVAIGFSLASKELAIGLGANRITTDQVNITDLLFMLRKTANQIYLQAQGNIGVHLGDTYLGFSLQGSLSPQAFSLMAASWPDTQLKVTEHLSFSQLALSIALRMGQLSFGFSAQLNLRELSIFIAVALTPPRLNMLSLSISSKTSHFSMLTLLENVFDLNGEDLKFLDLIAVEDLDIGQLSLSDDGRKALENFPLDTADPNYHQQLAQVTAQVVANFNAQCHNRYEQLIISAPANAQLTRLGTNTLATNALTLESGHTLCQSHYPIENTAPLHSELLTQQALDTALVPTIALSTDSVTATNDALGEFILTDLGNMRHFHINAQGAVSLNCQAYFGLTPTTFGTRELPVGIFTCGTLVLFYSVRIRFLLSLLNKKLSCMVQCTPINIFGGVLTITASEQQAEQQRLLAQIQSHTANAGLAGSLISTDQKMNGAALALDLDPQTLNLQLFLTGHISLLRLFGVDTLIAITQGSIYLHFSLSWLGIKTTINFSCAYRDIASGFSFSIEIDTSALAQAIASAQRALKDAAAKVRQGVEHAISKLNSAKAEVDKLNNQIRNFNARIEQCKRDIRNSKWYQFWIKIARGAEIAGLEIAKAGVWLAMKTAQLTLDIAIGVVGIGGKIAEGALNALNKVIGAVTMIFFLKSIGISVTYSASQGIKLAGHLNLTFFGKDIDASFEVGYNPQTAAQQFKNELINKGTQKINDKKNEGLNEINKQAVKNIASNFDAIDDSDSLTSELRRLNTLPLEERWERVLFAPNQDGLDLSEEQEYYQYLQDVNNTTNALFVCSNDVSLQDSDQEMLLCRHSSNELTRYNQRNQAFTDQVNSYLDADFFAATQELSSALKQGINELPQEPRNQLQQRLLRRHAANDATNEVELRGNQLLSSHADVRAAHSALPESLQHTPLGYKLALVDSMCAHGLSQGSIFAPTIQQKVRSAHKRITETIKHHQHRISQQLSAVERNQELIQKIKDELNQAKGDVTSVLEKHYRTQMQQRQVRQDGRLQSQRIVVIDSNLEQSLLRLRHTETDAGLNSYWQQPHMRRASSGSTEPNINARSFAEQDIRRQLANTAKKAKKSTGDNEVAPLNAEELRLWQHALQAEAAIDDMDTLRHIHKDERDRLLTDLEALYYSNLQTKAPVQRQQLRRRSAQQYEPDTELFDERVLRQSLLEAIYACE